MFPILKGLFCLLLVLLVACSPNPGPMVLPKSENAMLAADVSQDISPTAPAATPMVVTPTVIAPVEGFKGELYFYPDHTGKIRAQITLFDIASRSPIRPSFVIVRLGDTMLFNGSVGNERSELPIVDLELDSPSVKNLSVQITDALDGRKCTLTVAELYVLPDGVSYMAVCGFE